MGYTYTKILFTVFLKLKCIGCPVFYVATLLDAQKNCWASFFFRTHYDLSSKNYQNLLAICLYFQALSAFGINEFHKVTNHL